MTDWPLLSAALAYAARGWPVFPCHGIVDAHVCTCARGANCDRPGKHPRISAGRNGATTDPDTIRRWWTAWPDANVAIVTGRESGLIVIDVDGEGEALRGRELPDTVEQITGSGGRHLFYRRPEGDDRYKTTTSVLPGVDSRADGGYVIAPPSRHVSGRTYAWEVSSDPEDVQVAEAPAWWIDLIRAPAIGAAVVGVPEWDPDGDLPPTIIDMLSHIPADEYTIWRDVGMALHYTDPSDQGFRVFDWWSSTSERYDPEGVRREWRNWSRRGHPVATPVTLATVRRMAEAHGWTDPDVEVGAEIAAQLIRSHQEKITARLQRGTVTSIEPPEHLIPEHGLIGDIARWIERCAVRPQPRLSLAAATAFVATLAGRRYQSPTGLRTNLYLVGLAPTGAGKDHARKSIYQLAVAARVDGFLGGSRIASGSAIANSLERQPIKLYMLDEFGLMLQAIANDSASGHRRDIVTTLLELYSAAGGVWLGTEYADPESRPRQQIHNPHVCLYGTSTGAAFWPALRGAHVLDGTLNRMLVVDTGEQVPARRRAVAVEPPPSEIVQAIRQLVEARPGAGNLQGRTAGQVAPTAYMVPMTPEVEDAEFSLALELDGRGDTPASRAIYSRVNENAIKLALTHAISIDPEHPIIGPESWIWGRDMALWCANVLLDRAGRYMADSETEGNLKRVMAVIAEAGEEGITRRELRRAVRGLSIREFDEALKQLLEEEAIAMMTRQQKGAGRPAQVYLALENSVFRL